MSEQPVDPPGTLARSQAHDVIETWQAERNARAAFAGGEQP